MATTTKTATATVNTAFGKPIPALNLSADYQAYEKYGDIPTEKLPTQEDILNDVNKAEANRVIAKERTAQFAALGYAAPEVPEDEKLANTIQKKHPEWTIEDCLKRARIALA
jgi:hypothetical protein